MNKVCDFFNDCDTMVSCSNHTERTGIKPSLDLYNLMFCLQAGSTIAGLLNLLFVLLIFS